MSQKPATAQEVSAKKRIFLVEDLSPREAEVLRFIGQGWKTAEVSQALCLSPKTVETYREKLKRKLGLKNAAELARFAFHSDDPPKKAITLSLFEMTSTGWL